MISGVRIVVLGKQGSGKGTQCVQLSHHYGAPHVSTGDMLRREVKLGTELGLRAKRLMDNGELVSDELIMQMVASRLSEQDARTRGFILDGCPRTILQAEELNEILQPTRLSVAVDLEVPNAVVVKRIASRRVCVECGANYSVESPPAVNWTCDVCGGKVIQRDDDTEDAIRRRFEIYDLETAPLIEWYKERGLLAKIDGTGTAETVMKRIVAAINEQRT